LSLSTTSTTTTTITHNYLNGAIVFTNIGGGGTVAAPITASMNLTNIPINRVAAYTTTFIINQTGTSKGYIRTIGINGSYLTPEFIGTLPAINASTSTIIQTITAVMNNATITKLFTNTNVCSGTV
jgi:hypothetical protein